MLRDWTAVLRAGGRSSSSHLRSGVDTLALHDFAQVVNHLCGIFKVLVIHAFLSVVDLSNGVAREATSVLMIVEAVPDKGAVLDLDGKTEGMRARQIGCGETAGVGKVTLGHW